MGISYRNDTQKWVVRIRNKKLNIDYTKSFKSKTLANKDEIRVLAEIEAGTFMKEDNKITFKEAAELYMKNVANIHCKDTTLESYHGYLNNHITPYFAEKRLCNITKLDCDKFVKYLSEKNCTHIRRTKNGVIKVSQSKKLSNETINHIIFLSNAIFEYMIDSDIIINNPMKRVKNLSCRRNK